MIPHEGEQLTIILTSFKLINIISYDRDLSGLWGKY